MNSKFFHKLYNKVKTYLLGEFPKVSYSRGGEDLLLDEILNYKMKGVYVDVGAYHPIQYSNTFKFYLRGWTGINIDPNKEAIDLFNKVRPKDINLNLAISKEAGTYTYYMHDADPTMNTISKDFSDEAIKNFSIKVSEKRQVIAKRLDQLLLEVNIDSKNIDLLNIDAEGHDLEVLMSNDWINIRPRIILVEINSNLEQIKENDIYKFLTANNYTLLSYTFLNSRIGNVFFKNADK
jgi:FkbM family methyltransferase